MIVFVSKWMKLELPRHGTGLEGLNLASLGKNKFQVVDQYSQDRVTVPAPIYAQNHIAYFLFFLPKNTTHLHYKRCF